MENYKVSSNLAISESGFIFQPNSGESFTLNETAILILSKLKSELPSQKIIEEITEEFDIDKQTAEKDFYEFLTQLKNFGMVTEL